MKISSTRIANSLSIHNSLQAAQLSLAADGHLMRSKWKWLLSEPFSLLIHAYTTHNITQCYKSVNTFPSTSQTLPPQRSREYSSSYRHFKIRIRMSAYLYRKLNPFSKINEILRLKTTQRLGVVILNYKNGRYTGRSSRDGAPVLVGREKQFKPLRAACFSVVTKHGGSEQRVVESVR